MKRAFKMKEKAFFIIFKGLLVAKKLPQTLECAFKIMETKQPYPQSNFHLPLISKRCIGDVVGN